MAKEAKIGFAVIAVLLTIFGVVVFNRLNGPNDTALTSAEKDTDKAAAEDNDTTAANGTAQGSSSTKVKKPTVLAAKATSSKTLKETPSSPTGHWAVVTSGDDIKQPAASGPARSASAPPSFMPVPLAPTPSSRYTASGSGQDPFQRQAIETEAATDVARSAPAARAPGNPASDLPPFQQAPAPRSDPQQLGVPVGSDAVTANDDDLKGTSSRYGQDTTARRQISAYGGDSRSPYQTSPQPARAFRQYTVSNTSSAGSAPAVKSDAPARRNEDGTYTVQPNDSYWIISQKLYGNGAFFKALAEHNRQKYPLANKLRVGDKIAAPDEAELLEAFPGLCPSPDHNKVARQRASVTPIASGFTGGRVYVVEEGDTLYDIARFELGNASRWVEIHSLNTALLGDDFDYITPGTKLVLPQADPTDTLTRRPTSPYQR